MKFRQLLPVIAAAALLAACSSSSDDAGGASGAGGAGGMGGGSGYSSGGNGSGRSGGPAPGSTEEFMTVVGDRVFFNTDQYSLTAEGQAVLRNQAAWLRKYPNRSVVVEGHADERGTREYNLALGERRASSVKDFLLAQGIPAQRLRVVSYGKERPVCAQSSDDCWQQNRRGVSVLQ